MLIDEFGRIVTNKEMKKDVIFFGASTRNKIAIQDLGIAENTLYFVDSDQEKDGTILDGYKVFTVDKIALDKNVIILSVLTNHMTEVINKVRLFGDYKCFFYIPEIYDVCHATKSNRNILEQHLSYKYIHIFPNDKFIRPFYAMIEENFLISEHLFIVDYTLKEKNEGAFGYSDILERNRKNGNILVLDDVHDGLEFVYGEKNCNLIFETEKMNRIFKSAQRIIFHSAFWSANGKKLVQSLVEKMNNKVTWICWGGDSYFESDSDVIKNILKKIKHAYASEERTVRIKNIYEIPVKCTNATYTYTSLNQQIYMNSSKENFEQKKAINILLGHSAAEYSNHQLGFELLKKYKDENIRIFCPLSYGSEIYRNKVIKMGKEMFGDKFVPMLKFMEQNEYYEFLNTIDVAVFPLTRMAAGTTLIYLNAIGTKIYMSTEQINNFSTLNIQAEDIYDIEKKSFKEFIIYSTLDVREKIENIKKLNDKVVSEWTKIIEEMGERL